MYEIFSQLLQKFGVTAYKVSKATGISQSSLSDWKLGKITPKTENMKKIADYFGVSLEYLMTGEEKDGGETYYLNEETAKIAQDIFENKELRLLFDTARNAEPEDLLAVHNMLLALKRKEQHYDD
ncbi:MAG: helix-turn-helix transcriptional regulator [Lachnospiraceae bacterium]|nr:helix-turn-helix transcriptional regulator [Lachnospiraceae bacterium]